MIGLEPRVPGRQAGRQGVREGGKEGEGGIKPSASVQCPGQIRSDASHQKGLCCTTEFMLASLQEKKLALSHFQTAKLHF